MSTTAPVNLPHRPNFLLVYWRKIGGGSLALSIAIHVGILAAAALIFTTINQERSLDYLPGSKAQGADKASAALKQQVTTQSQKRVARETPLVKLQSLDPKAGFKLPAIDMELPEVGSEMLASSRMSSGGGGSGTKLNMGTGDGPGTGLGLGSRDGMTPFSALLRGRCNTAERLKKLSDNGGNPQCEMAVSRSLEWLKTQQNADGSWGRQHRGAMTGFALLCYLGRCYDADNVFYGETVTKAMLKLVELGQKNPQNIFSERPEQHSACYEHGIATYALGEMWSFMRLGKKQMPGVREAFEKGVQVIIDYQLPDGGWGYGEGFCYRRNGGGDLSVTGWQFQALKAAHFSGLKIKGLDVAIGRALDYLESNQTADGGFGRANREQGYNQWNLTGVGLLGLQTLGKNKLKTEVRKGIAFASALVTAEPPDWNKNCNLYTWYYLAQAFFQEGGESWKQWNSMVLPHLLANQNPDGSWKDETADSAVASTSPAGADRAIYRTALCTLMLEVYFRYLKVGDRDEGSMFNR